MKLIDRYILWKFLSTFFFMLGIIMMISIVFDISEHIDDFLDEDVSLKEIVFDFYLNFIVYYGNMFSALIVFISTILFTSRMTQQTEVVTILTSGISFRRILWPYFVGATLVFSLSMVLSHFVIPKTNETRIKFEHTYISKPKDTRFQNIYRQIRPGEIIYLENFNDKRKSGYHFSYEKFGEGKLLYKLKSDFIRYDSISKNWRLDNWQSRILLADGSERIDKGFQKDTVFSFSAEELTPKLYTIAMMDTPELLDFIEAERVRGSTNLVFYEVELHKRSSYPTATFILVLIALTLSTKKTRGGLGGHIAMGFFICFLYIFFMQVSTTLSTNAGFSPLMGVWIPNIIFTVLGVYLYIIAPK